MSSTSSNRQLTIELLALDLNTCGRCTGTSANLDSALQTIAEVFREADVDVKVRRTVVTSAAQAESLRFESSPTIRINGRDIALALRESSCGDCGDLCGCDGQIDCRVWVWRGGEYTEAPKALIVDALLRAYSQAWEARSEEVRPYHLPDNLRKYFESTAKQGSTASQDCCDLTTCCDESERETCCGVDSSYPVCGCKV